MTGQGERNVAPTRRRPLAARELADPLARHQAFSDEADRLVRTAPDAIRPALAVALARAYEAGAGTAGSVVRVDRLMTLADVSPLGRAVLRRLSDLGEAAVLRRGEMDLPGMPWNVHLPGGLAMEGRYAASIPDAPVFELLSLGLLSRVDGGLAPVPAIADLAVGGALPAPARGGALT